MKILNESQLLRVWKLKADIPNQKGFELIVLLADGRQAITEVIRDEITHCHSLAICNEIGYTGILGWRDITPEERKSLQTALKK